MNILPMSGSHRKWIRKLHGKKFREETGVFIAEGFNALEAAIATPFHPILEIAVDENHTDKVSDILSNDVPVYTCSDSIMRDISTEKTPQGVVMICHRKEFQFHDLEREASDTLLYLDRVSDPGNLGTIMRTAAWFDIRQLILSPSCVDPFNTKVIRSSAGALFSTELYQSVNPNQVYEFAAMKGYRLVATVPRGGIPSNEWKRQGRTIILLGQESSGLSDELTQHADQFISIPGRGNVESLNLSVAAAIILYEATK